MSDYTPTTEEVRELVVAGHENQYRDELGQLTGVSYGIEFDRWLATERVRMAELAQEKLIDKIKAIRDREANYGDYDYYYGVDALLEELGENK